MQKEHINVFESYVNKVKDVYAAQGLIVGIFDKSDVLYEYTVGYRDVEQELPIDRDTIFGIASITKSFTVIGILQLVEKGLIDLDAPISQYYENWALEKERTPTVRQLMSHGAGFFPQERFLMKDFASDLGIDNVANLATSDELAEAGIASIIKRLNQAEFFNGPPGKRFSYSNFSFGILTDLVRKFSTYTSYAEAVEEDVLRPMGMANSFFDFARTGKEENISTLYTSKALGVETTMDYTDLGFVLLGGGALKSTFNDLMVYTRMFLNDGLVDGNQVLSKKSIEAMAKERISYKEHQGYGYGLVVGDLESIRYAGHSGGLTGVSSFFGYSKDSGKGVVVLCNTGGVPATSIGIAALRLAHDQYPSYKVGQYPEGLWSKATIENTLGRYESEEGDKAEIQACGDGVKIIIDGKELTCRVVNDELMIIENKMEENYCRILRRGSGKAFGIYLGSRIIPRIN